MEEVIKEAIKSLAYEEAIKRLDEYIKDHPDDEEALVMRGMRHWGAGKRSSAINDYLTASRINPSGKGAQALKAAKEILDYRNNDMFNP